MDNAWKDKLRERFSDFSVPEPEGLWEGIEQGIAGKKRSHLLPVWLVSGAAAAAAVALAVILPSRRTSEEPSIDQTDRYAQSVPVDTAGRYPVTVVDDDPADQAAPIVTEPSKSVPFAVASRRSLLAEAKDIPAETIPVEDPVDVIPEVPADEVAEIPVEEVTKIPEEIPAVIPVEEKTALAETVTEIQTAASSPRFTVGVFNEGGQTSSETSQGYGMNNTNAVSTRTLNPDSNNMAPGGLVRMLSANRASSYDVHHHAPIRTGVAVSWRMTPHLALTSGVNWTALNSDFVESTDGTRNVVRQELGYLGIPLRLEAGFNPWKKLWLYAGAGGMVEKGLLASSRTDCYIGDHMEETLVGKPDTGGLLWSVGASAGAEYRFNRFLGVYFAPGVEYHFDNGSTVRSAYTEKPLSWNLSLGVRFNFGE